MRKQTEIQLIRERPQMYLPAVLKAYGIQYEASLSGGFGNRPIFKRENFFQCGEGWVRIIAAVAEGLDHHLGISETKYPQDHKAEDPIVFIAGASTHDHRLYLYVETNRAADEACGVSIDAMRVLATALSGRHCEICGTATTADDNKPVRCTICRGRES